MNLTGFVPERSIGLAGSGVMTWSILLTGNENPSRIGASLKSL